MHRKFFSQVLIILVTLCVALGQQAAPANVPSIERLRVHIEYLASDKLEGRRTGTAGANLAAEYIAHEFSRYGLRSSNGYDTPGMSRLEANSPKRYLQEFPYVAGVDLGKKNELVFQIESKPDSQPTRERGDSFRLQLGEDWLPLGLSTNGRIENAAAVLVGYGLTVNELKYDDYASANVAGKIAVAFSGTPDGANPHGPFARFDDVRWKAIAARNAGAKALIVIAAETNFKDDPLSRLRYNNSAGDAGIPVGAISRQAGERLLSKDSPLLLIDKQGLKAPQSGQTNISAPPLQNVSITLSTDVVRRQVGAQNVIGILDGSDPVLKKEVVVIGAHYDHLGRGGEGSLATKEGEIHYGADDNASGTAGMLELARIFAAEKPRPRRTLVFIAFSGEEEGLLGSNYYVNHPVAPIENTVAMINMDMIGRMKVNQLVIGGVGTAEGWRQAINDANFSETFKVTATAERAAATGGAVSPAGTTSRTMIVGANGRPIVSVERARQFDLTLNEDGFGPSDHSSFYAKKVPVLFLWTGVHEDYHKPTDTADKINYDDEARVIAFAARLIGGIDSNDKRPVYSVASAPASSGRSMGFRVYLGTIPNYAGDGEGLLLDGVREDSPAAKAGLQAGDRVVRLAGLDVRNVEDYTYALGQMKAAQEYEVVILRGTERLTLKITPAARR